MAIVKMSIKIVMNLSLLVKTCGAPLLEIVLRCLRLVIVKAADEMYLQKCWNRNRISASQILMEMQQKCSSSFSCPPSKVDQAGIEVGFHSQDLQRQGMGSFGNWKDESSNLVLMNSNGKLHHTLPFGYSNLVPGGRQLLCTASRGRTYSTFAEKEFEEDDTGGQQASLPIQEERSGGGQQSSLENPDSKPSSTMSSWPNPDNAASYVLMSNIYADGDRWDEAKRINEMRLKARAWKKPGKAYVEIKVKVHEFIVGDRTHQDSVNIYEKLRKIKRHMGHIGYVPYVDLVLENRSYYDPYAKPR
ncbi:hypothetical protein KP509_18G082100 [Ceratopteris richardii]|uniref:Uncharacterized protein n=1 Tax=Ceratopteris richardii TaxID=49495 RepID=A0A8T2SS36_CERRI|nr:hypothetical protein KP509_18G082100 [Ceratopteris richardii]